VNSIDVILVEQLLGKMRIRNKSVGHKLPAKMGIIERLLNISYDVV